MADEMIIGTFRRFTRLSLDDCLYALQPAIPRLTRSSLQRCLVRNELNKLDDIPSTAEEEQRPGVLFMNIARIITDEGTMYSYTAFDEFAKLVYSRPESELSMELTLTFVRDLVAVLPYPVRRIITNDEAMFTRPDESGHCFAATCTELDIVHDIVEERTLWRCPPEKWATDDRKDAPRYSTRYQTRDGEAVSTSRWMHHYTFNVRLKALRGLTPFANLCQLWEDHPDWFKWDPTELRLDITDAPH